MAGLAGYMIYRLCTRSSTMRADAAAQATPPEAATTGGFSGENLGTATPSAPPQPLHVAIFTSTCVICLNDIEDGERLLGFEGRIRNALTLSDIYHTKLIQTAWHREMAMSKTLHAATSEDVSTYRIMLRELVKEKGHEKASYRVPANPWSRGCSPITRCRGGPGSQAEQHA
ncbi:hypothetical protein RJ639_026590 [Escallonia herrerae]|uniref:Uncharacterized protein n=1 Tax=Escallonia herrerae TaxID=1293975 RepID=A0AA88S883_9ASTE|nr:hypothetical protein RJ639_026590 [Escallonia herrerae]